MDAGKQLLFDVSLNTIAGQVVLMVEAVGVVAVLPIHSVGVVMEVIVGGCGSGNGSGSGRNSGIGSGSGTL